MCYILVAPYYFFSGSIPEFDPLLSWLKDYHADALICTIWNELQDICNIRPTFNVMREL